MPDLRQTPVHQQDFAERPDQDVLRLDVAMRHAVAVGVLQGVADLDHHFDQAHQVVALAEVEDLPQRIAMHQLHGEEVVPRHIAAELVGGHGIRVLQHRRDPCLAHEAALRLGVVRELGFQRLVADHPHQVQILAGLDDGPAAPGDGLEVRVARVRMDALRQRLVRVVQGYDRIVVERLRETGHRAYSSTRRKRSIRLEVSQRPPPNACTSA